MTSGYAWYGGADIALTAGDNNVSFDFTVDMATSDEIKFKFSLGKIADVDTSVGKLTFTDITVSEVTE